MKKIDLMIKRINSILLIFVVAFFASQCFAQSASPSANEKTNKSRQYMELMNGVFDFVQKNYVDEIDPQVLYEGALKGMLESLKDPYTVYLDKTSFRSISDTTSGSFGGVGLQISKPVETSKEKPAYVEVASPVEDTPGFKAGILAGDLIISINGTDTSTITMEQVLDMLRGKVGESVDLVIRRGKNMEFPVTLVRAIIEVPTVKYGMIEGTKIGYVRLIEFTPQAVERFQEALDSFKKNNAVGMIFDLRNNPGGLITSAADIADKFIDNGPIVTTKSRLSFENSVFTATAKKTVMRNMPIVVLINKGSASASEIVSGALKDNHLAYLVGQRTYGKGSVQQVLPLSATDGLKITMARYYTPSDVNIDKIGIPPDREILFPVLSEEGEKQYLELYKSTEISDFVDGRTDLTEKQISDFAKTLKKKYSEIDESSLRKLVRNEANKTKGTMLYDLDYDIQLNEAISILQKENFTNLIKSTKTLKELQEMAVLEEEKSEKK
ncbi:MAG: S41 family peptidase [Treponema sp.]|uniref:S41 family peptidase n=1 Tax=unclassified Treponema TaxID=2638727 RepID=UPI0025D95B15|nr:MULTISPECIES: S41 family peptidase [unclassified Treponema]MBQ8678589.1 S41 family peptidase [Treponema sp.]